MQIFERLFSTDTSFLTSSEVEDVRNEVSPAPGLEMYQGMIRLFQDTQQNFISCF
uniref:hypothetical protein n=1 Tax=Prevotella sp. TaxID=59823 RepID=UPI004025BDB9